MSLPKVKFFIGIIFSFFLLLFFSRPVNAQCLINIPDWSEGQVNQCLKAGGTIALVGSYGNFGGIYQETAKIVKTYNDQQTDPANKMAIEYRLYNDARPATAEEVQAMVAIMGKNPTGAPSLIRVSNEWTTDWVWSNMPYEEKVKNYLDAQYAAWQAINSSGANISLVDGMMDYMNPGTNLDDVISRINTLIKNNPQEYSGWNNWSDSFDVLAINGYPEPGNFGQLGPYRLEDILSKLPEGKAWRFSEFGYKLPDQNRPQYDNPQFLKQNIVSLLGWLANNPKYAQTFAGFNIFTRDPHIPEAENIASTIMEIMNRNPGLRSAILALEGSALANPQKFEAWLKEMINDKVLEECLGANGEFLGYAPPGMCDVGLAGPQVFEEPPNACVAGSSKPPKGIFRPKPCADCSLDVPEPVNACADPFTLKKETTWKCGELVECNGAYVAKKTWSASFSLNTEDTKTPFAGYRDIVKNDEDRVVNLNNYLADYLGGTSFYDKQPFNPQDPKQVQNMIMEAGVFRKLAPAEIQDNLRKEMILKGYNYEITDGSTVKHMQDWAQKPLPYPLGNFPPNRKTAPEIYAKNLKAWLKTPFGFLWHRIPLFTLEDAPAKAILTVEHEPGRMTPQGGGAPVNPYGAEFPLAVPHVGRLYEASKNLNQLLMPNIKGAQTASVSAKIIDLEKETCSSIFGEGLMTALGCVPTTLIGFTNWFIHFGSFLGGGIAFLLMAYGAFVFITSAGDPEKIKLGKTIFVSAITGLLVIIGSVFLLEFIAVKILKLPGFSQQPASSNQLPVVSSQSSVLLAQANNNNQESGVRSQELILKSQISNHKSQILLAQADPALQPNDTNQPEIIVQDIGGGRFTVSIFTGGHLNDPRINGQLITDTSGHEIHTSVAVSYDDGATWLHKFSPEWNGNMPILKEGESIVVNVSFRGDDMAEQFGRNFFGYDCKITNTGGKLDMENCAEALPYTGPAPEQRSECANDSNVDGSCSGNNPQEDTKPNDPVCCDAKANVKVDNYIIPVFGSYSEYEQACLLPCLIDTDDDDGKCDPTSGSTTMTREVENKLELPYLEEIYKKTNQSDLGFFNLFRLAGWPSFPDNDAQSNIEYQINIDDGSSYEENGNFYFPLLGGVQRAKKCISEYFLLPKVLQPDTNYCDFWEDYLKNQASFNLNQQGGIGSDPGLELNNLDCSNSNFNISSSAKQAALQTAGRSWPANILADNWDRVAVESKNNGWNPACVIALWIEETGGSHMVSVGRSTASLGCLEAKSNDPQTNLEESLDCFFSRENSFAYQGLETGSREWWLTYSEGSSHKNTFSLNPNFPRNFYNWYQRLTK